METVIIALIGLSGNIGGILLNRHLSRKERQVDANLRKNCATADVSEFVTDSPAKFAAPPVCRSAILSFISGLAGLFIFGLFAIAAIVAGYRAERNIIELNGSLRGIGLARAGLILGYLGGVLLSVVAAMWITVGLN